MNFLQTSLNEINGWKIDHKAYSIEKDGNKVQIKVERAPARLGQKKLPFGSLNLKPKYGSLFKPEHDEYVVYENGREILRDPVKHYAIAAIYQYFRNERRCRPA